MKSKIIFRMTGAVLMSWFLICLTVPAFAQVVPAALNTSQPALIKAPLLKTVTETQTGTATETQVVSPDKFQKIGSAARAATESRNKPQFSIESFISDYWVQFLALIVSLIGVALAVTGFTFAGAKKKKSVTKFLHSIDDTFAAYKWKSRRCEAELYRLHDLVDEQLKKGKIDEGSYQLLMNRIDKYLAEIKDIDRLPPHLKEKT